jgi:hypothetical protein
MPEREVHILDNGGMTDTAAVDKRRELAEAIERRSDRGGPAFSQETS